MYSSSLPAATLDRDSKNKNLLVVLTSRHLLCRVQKVLEPFQYISNVPGKDIRARLIDAFNHWLNIPEDKLSLVKTIVSKLHNASLMCVMMIIRACGHRVGGFAFSICPSSTLPLVSSQRLTFSCRIDDIEDNSKLRRGVPVVHHIYGTAATINSANYVYFETLKLTHDSQNPMAMEAFVGAFVLVVYVYIHATVHFSAFSIEWKRLSRNAFTT